MDTTDGYVQVAPDNTGKKIDMGQRQSIAADLVHVQRAEMVGPAAEALKELNEVMKQQLAVMRAILFVLGDGSVEEEQFYD